MKDNKKVIISSILGVIALCIITLSLTYAYWQINKNQTGENVVNTDCFNIEFVGENDINLPKAYPLNNEELEEFITTETPYTFTITNKCSSLASATINMETVPVDGKKLSDEWIDVLLYDAVKNNPNSYLNKSKKLTGNSDNTENKVIETSESAYALHSFTLKANEEKKFNLLIYMNQDTPASEENMNATWKGKITLSTSYKVDQFADAGTLRQITYSEANGMWKYKDKLTKIVIENKILPKEGTVVYGPFDESVDSSNSIQSYVVCEDGDTNCIGYLQGNGGIKLNENSSYLFYNFVKVTTIEGLENLDTSNVTDTSFMFQWMKKLTKLSLGDNFDIDRVINAKQMFHGMESLQELNLGNNFNTSNVENMSAMFDNSTSLLSLNLGDKFDTSNVTNMSSMFANMKALQELNLGSKFNTSSVKYMSYMFNNMNALQELNLGSKFDTSSVELMFSMFSNMNSLQELNLGSKFNTSKVTDMNRMFNGMSNLQSLDLSTSNFDTSNVEDMSSMFGGDELLTTINYGANFIHKEGASTLAMFGGKDESGIYFANCPANQPDISTHASWEGVSFAGV